MIATVKFPALAETTPAQARSEYARAKFYIKDHKPEVASQILQQLATRYVQTQLAGLLDVHNVSDVLWEAAETNGLIDHFSADYIQETLSTAIKFARSNPEVDPGAPESIIQVADYVNNQVANSDPLIEDIESGSIIGRAEAGIIFGPTGTGKTVVTMEMCFAISSARGLGRTLISGQPIYKCSEGRVLVAVYEAPQDYKRRLRAIAANHDVALSDLDWAIISADCDITKDKDRALLLQRIRSDAEKNGAPALVVIDTMPAAVGGKSLNDDDVVGNCYAFARTLINEFSATIIFVAHPGKDETRGIAGSYRLQGNADFILRTVKTKAGFRLIKMKDRGGSLERPLFDYSLQFPEVERTKSGNPLTAAIIGSIVPCERQELGQPLSISSKAMAKVARKLSPRQKLALDALTEAIITSGIAPPRDFELPATQLAVPVDQWRQEIMDRGIVDADAKNPRTEFKRVKDSLLARSLIGERKGFIWPCC